MKYMLGIDVGGTFTDFSVYNLETGEFFNYKDSSTPEDSSKGIIAGIQVILEKEQADPGQITYIAHGTTVGTNALIEKKGASVGLITTRGFKDLLEIGNQRRPSLYDLQMQKPAQLIPSGCNCEVEERIIYDGSVETPLDENGVRVAVRYLKKKGVAAIAVCTLFSFINPAHEKRIKEIILEEYPEAYVTISSELIPEFREYSRMSTTVLNSYLGPVMEKYVRNFQNSLRDIGITSEPYVTQSNGSIISIRETIDCPIKCAVSGPSAGVVAAVSIAKLCRADKVITFDMGGTSTDISLIENYTPQITNDRTIDGHPVHIPMINIITIGAGGGSIAGIDEGNALKVGPKSAGARPGPACYMRGGDNPCVTDANIVLGKLSQKKILGGRMDVDVELAKKAIADKICAHTQLSVTEAANGIITVVNSNMMRAIRAISVEKGYDVREFSLMAFGGAGPLHACEVAKELGIRRVIVPPQPGTLCSVGLLMADTRFDMSRTRVLDGKAENLPLVNELFAEMAAQGEEFLSRENIAEERRSFEYSIDIRYQRQNFEISIPIPAEPVSVKNMQEAIRTFHAEHERRYGYCNEAAAMQFVSYRVTAVGVIDKPPMVKQPERPDAPQAQPFEFREVLFQGDREFTTTPVYRRFDILPHQSLSGPCICEQMDTTIVVPRDWTIRANAYNDLMIDYEVGQNG